MAQQRATDRVRAYPKDGHTLRVLAKKRGGKTMPADIIKELLVLFKGKLKTASQLK